MIGRAIEALPPMQAEVIRLRDVLGWSSEEVRNALGTDRHQSAGAPASCAREAARGDVDAPQEREHMTNQIVCRDLLELITGYLDGALPADVHAAIEDTCRAATGARRCSRSSAPRSRSRERSQRSRSPCTARHAAGRFPGLGRLGESARRVSACWTSPSFPISARCVTRLFQQRARLARTQLPVRIGRVLQLLVGLDDQLEDLLGIHAQTPVWTASSSCRSR